MLSRFPFFFLVFVTPVFAEEPRMLRMHWIPGKTYILETTTENSSRDLKNGSAGQSMRVIQTSSLEVTENEKKERLVKVRFEHVRGQVSSGSRSLKFDSAKPEEAEPTLQRAFGRAVGKTFVLAYDNQDRFLDVRDVASLAEVPGAVTGLSALADSRNVANVFRKSLELGLPPLAVSLNDTWTADENISFPQAGDTHVEMNGKFEAIESREGRPHAKISFEGALATLERKDKPIGMIEIAKGSTMSGLIFYDLERRTVALGVYTTHINLDLAGQVVPFEQRIQSSVLSIKDSH